MKKFKEKRMASYVLRSNELIQEGKTKEAAELFGYLQSQREWLFTLLGGKMEDSHVQQMPEMWEKIDGSGKH